MIKVQDYVLGLLQENRAIEVAEILGVSQPMISAYKKGGYNASLEVAIKAYRDSKIVLFPFAEEALQELSK